MRAAQPRAHLHRATSAPACSRVPQFQTRLLAAGFFLLSNTLFWYISGVHSHNCTRCVAPAACPAVALPCLRLRRPQLLHAALLPWLWPPRNPSTASSLHLHLFSYMETWLGLTPMQVSPRPPVCLLGPAWQRSRLGT